MPYVAALFISAATFVGLYNYLPLDLVTFNEGRPTFGATITTIAGTDTLSASRSVINTNFSNLNTDKLERSQYFSTTTHATITSIPNLASIGTITSGTWNGTAIGVAYGGTGSTTLALNHVMLGNTTSGFKTVAGLGSSGQVLMSNGAGTPPTWQSSSVNQTVTYNWTAHHIFTSLFGTNASTTNATTTNLHVSGAASFTNEQWSEKMYLNANTPSISGSSASTTIFAFSVPANTLGTNNAISCDFRASAGLGSTRTIVYEFAYGNATTTFQVSNSSGGGENIGPFNFLLAANGTTNSQVTTYWHPITSTANINMSTRQTSSIDSTQTNSVVLVAKTPNSSDSLAAGVVICELIR